MVFVYRLFTFYFSKLSNTKMKLKHKNNMFLSLVCLSLSVLCTQEVSDDITRVLSDTSHFLTTLPWQQEEKVRLTLHVSVCLAFMWLSLWSPESSEPLPGCSNSSTLTHRKKEEVLQHVRKSESKSEVSICQHLCVWWSNTPSSLYILDFHIPPLVLL